MNIEDRPAKTTYIQMLIDILKRKSEVFGRLVDLTEQQEIMIGFEDFDEDKFSDTISKKDELINILNQLDNGFEQLYERVKDELISKKDIYRSEITIMQELITKLTDISVILQAMEKRNKLKLEAIFSNKRRAIKSSRVNGQMAASYYKSMANQIDKSIFYDKKK